MVSPLCPLWAPHGNLLLHWLLAADVYRSGEKTTMPVPLSYPGVYVEEIPSGVRTITGVATSITAFVGRAMWGPFDTPVTIFGFGDFQRQFGGLGTDYPMSYAVADFFRN